MRRAQRISLVVGIVALLGAGAWFASSMRTVVVRDPALRLEHGGGGGGPLSIDVSADLCATGNYNGRVSLWDLPSGARRHDLDFTSSGDSRAIGISPNGAFVAAGGIRGLRVWSTKDGAVIRDLDMPFGCAAMAFSPDSASLLASDSNGDVVRMWDPAAGKLIRSLTFPAKSVYCLAWSPAGDRFAVSGESPRVVIYSTATGAEERTLDTPGPWVTQVAFSAELDRIAAAGFGHVTFFDGAGRPVRTYPAPDGICTGVVLLPDGRFAVSSIAGEVWLYGSRWPHHVERKLVPGNPGGIDRLSFVPRFRWIAASCHDGVVRMFETD